jgi:hypothetical protein
MEESPSTGSLQVTVAFDRHEHSAAQWAASNRGPLLLRPVLMMPVVLIGGVLLSRALSALQHPGGLSAVGSALGALLSVGFLFYAVRLNRRRSEENERHEQNPDVYTLNDAGLEISGVDDLTLLLWSNMTRVHETKRFFLFVSGWEVQYLPKRALEPAQADVVRGLVLRHGPASGRSLPGPPRPWGLPGG